VDDPEWDQSLVSVGFVGIHDCSANGRESVGCFLSVDIARRALR
jgi:hypothetical protein